MSKRKLKIIVLFDVPAQELTQVSWRELIFKDKEYQDEKDVIEALARLGHEVNALAIFDNLEAMIEEFRSKRYDLAFNMFETYANDRSLAAHLTSVLEVMRIPYTGASPSTLNLCQDKSLSKKVLQYHGIKVPKFATVHDNRDYDQLGDMIYPAIVKPLGLDASEGISQSSVVNNAKQAISRCQFVKKKYGTPAIVEEYVAGKEFYLSFIGGKEPQIFSPRQLHFKRPTKTKHQILTFKAKWDETYRRKYGIDSGHAKNLTSQTLRTLTQFAYRVSRALGISRYTRIDVRMNDAGEVYFIEANPNPAIKRTDDFSLSAQESGLNYDELIQKIILEAA